MCLIGIISIKNFVSNEEYLHSFIILLLVSAYWKERTIQLSIVYRYEDKKEEESASIYVMNHLHQIGSFNFGNELVSILHIHVFRAHTDYINYN